jgi:hypothetical protein
MLSGERLNRYTYGQCPLREEVLERFPGAHGEPFAAVTRNNYGALVLNAARVMFIDLDFPPISAGEQWRYWWARLLRKSVRSLDAQREDDARKKLEQFIADHPDWSLRAYRTFGGLRALATHDLFEPTAARTLDTLQMLGTDPLYVRLCKAQECFRARLTPKPWRCGCASNTVRWPRDDAEQRRFEQWQSGYLARQANYATCRFLATLGHGRVHPDVERIVAVHDELTRCRESLELA